MFTPKIFLIKIRLNAPWEDQREVYSYLHEVDTESNTWEQCDFQSGAQLFDLKEANKVCAWLNKTNKNFFEIDIKQVYMNTRQSKINHV
jgi:hypothetical protein